MGRKAQPKCSESTQKFFNKLKKQKEVERLLPGRIQPTPCSGSNGRKVKITEEDRGLYLKIRGNTTVQRLGITTTDKKETIATIEKIAKKNGFAVEFMEPADV